MKIKISWKEGGGYKITEEEFKNEGEFDKFWDEAISDHRERKPINFERQ